MTPIVIPRDVLEAARTFFEDRGAYGFEGTAMICQTLDGHRSRLIIPTQVAASHGCWVEVPLEGKLELASSLAVDERYVARIHSHPGDAFHSATDDANPALIHEGALSLVVPYFGLGLRRGFENVAVFVRQGGVWMELPPGPQRDHWILVR